MGEIGWIDEHVTLISHPSPINGLLPQNALHANRPDVLVALCLHPSFSFLTAIAHLAPSRALMNSRACAALRFLSGSKK